MPSLCRDQGPDRAPRARQRGRPWAYPCVQRDGTTDSGNLGQLHGQGRELEDSRALDAPEDEDRLFDLRDFEDANFASQTPA